MLEWKLVLSVLGGRPCGYGCLCRNLFGPWNFGGGVSGINPSSSGGRGSQGGVCNSANRILLECAPP